MIPIKINDMSIIDKYYIAIKEFLNTPKRKYKYIDIDRWFLRLTEEKFNLEEVIKAEPQELEDIIQLIMNNPTYSGHDVSNKDGKGSDYSIGQYFIYIYKRFSNSNDDYFSNIGYHALQLITDLDLNVCPYCNRNFITSTKIINKTGQKDIKRTAQLDHFYPESEYPFLALAFYNLIPVCGTCNRIKHVNKIGVNPYSIHHSDEHILFDYRTGDRMTDVKVGTRYMSPTFKKNWDVLGLEELYQVHNAYLSDLLNRIKIYRSSYKKDLSLYLKKWSENEQCSEITNKDIDRVILGNYSLEEDLSKHPLSKLTKDIVRIYRS